MRRINILAGLSSVACVLMLTGCPWFGGVKAPFISHASAYFENIDVGFWSSTPPTTTCFVTFDVRLDDVGLIDSHFEYVEVRNSSVTWRLDPGDFSFDSANRVIHATRLHSAAWDAHSMPLSGWEIEVGLSNGYSDIAEAEYAPPGTAAVDPSVVAVYAVDYSGDTSNMAPMVSRAAITGATNDGTNLTIDFSVNDSVVYNCWLWLYDAGGDYIGRSEFGVDWESGTTNASVLNSGPLDTSGATVPLGSISEVNVILSDGGQYNAHYAWDYRSVSDTVFP